MKNEEFTHSLMKGLNPNAVQHSQTQLSVHVKQHEDALCLIQCDR